MEAPLTQLAEWESFYVIVGSSAAALTGLQFVVITIGSESRLLGGEPQVRAFATPTIVHFCATLLVSAIVSSPWHRLGSVAVALGGCGLAGLAYTAAVIRAARRQTGYKPVLEDVVWHFACPLAAYAAALLAAIILPHHPGPSLFVVGAAALLLLFTGIHNAWDAVTYLAIGRRTNPQAENQSDAPKDAPR
jgi:hypothetical protein